MLPWQFKKMGVVSSPRNREYVEETDIAGDLRFKVVCNSHFYNYSIQRNVAM